MATAALRAVLVVAAVVLGVFVLSRAFPSDDQVTPPTTPGQGEPTSPAPTSPAATETPDGEQPVQETHDPAEIRMQILNGTEVGGLAADTQATLEDAGWNVVTVGDAQNKPVEITIITFARRYRADAEVLEAEFFPGAELQQAAPDADADITVTLGVDYAEAQGAA